MTVDVSPFPSSREVSQILYARALILTWVGKPSEVRVLDNLKISFLIVALFAAVSTADILINSPAHVKPLVSTTR